MNPKCQFTIWVDADACPKVIKEVIFKVSLRRQILVHLVANSSMSIPLTPLVQLTIVAKGADVADFYIVEHIDANDLAITADIPLADLIVKKGALAINPRGETYTEENISERLSVRNFMQDLRDSGVDTGGPAPFGPKDRELFTNALDRILTKKCSG